LRIAPLSFELAVVEQTIKRQDHHQPDPGVAARGCPSTHGLGLQVYAGYFDASSGVVDPVFSV